MGKRSEGKDGERGGWGNVAPFCATMLASPGVLPQFGKAMLAELGVRE